MSGFLFAFSIGPVQEFIAAGRKTRDLWFGSELLSSVARSVALGLNNQGATLIFPSAAAALDENAPVANKILAIVTDRPSELGKEMRRRAQATVNAHLADVRQRFPTLPAPVDWPLAERQVASLLELASAWVPHDPDEYQTRRQQVERLLSGRKALRDFAPAPGADGVPKSALDPARETVLHWNGRRPATTQYGIRPGEQLDGVSLVKRLATPRRFVSVSRVAIDPFIRRLKQRDGERHLEGLRVAAHELERLGLAERFQATGHLAHYGAFPFDTQAFYGDGAEDPEVVTADQKAASAAFFKKVTEARQALKLGELSPYLAILAADGDHMGELISAQGSVEKHQRLSDQLAEFARAAQSIVAAHFGAPIYSGGDDVLALLPLDTALHCADRLQASFTQLVDTGQPGRQAHLSVGVALGHYGELLSIGSAIGRDGEPSPDLIGWARDAERAAKCPRNALAVSLHTHSGGAESTTTVASWDDHPVSTRWERWIDWHQRDALPDGAAYELRALARELVGLSPQLASDLAAREATRILLRKRAERGQRPLASADLNFLVARIRGATHPHTELAVLADELIIARRLARTLALSGWAPALVPGGVA